MFCVKNVNPLHGPKRKMFSFNHLVNFVAKNIEK